MELIMKHFSELTTEELMEMRQPKAQPPLGSVQLLT